MQPVSGIGEKTIPLGLKRQQFFDVFPQCGIVGAGAIQKVAAGRRVCEIQGIAKQIPLLFGELFQLFHGFVCLGCPPRSPRAGSKMIGFRSGAGLFVRDRNRPVYKTQKGRRLQRRLPW
jgi:hypothetical protein